MKLRWFFSQRTHQIHSIGPKTHVLRLLGPFRYGTKVDAKLAKLVPLTHKFADEDIATNDTSTPTPVSISTTPLEPITRARARRLTHQASSLLSSCSSYLENGDTCTRVLLRNHGLDQKGRGIAQAGFGLQDRHDL
jgi:hypothetical protein